MDYGLKGKSAVVCAASKGLGRATALGLAREGANVTICARGEEALRETAENIANETGAQVLAVLADVSDADQALEVIAQARARFGKIDILVTNAGGPPPGGFSDTPVDSYDLAHRLTLMSVVRLVTEVAPEMRERKWGRIINLTSLSVKQPVDTLILSLQRDLLSKRIRDPEQHDRMSGRLIQLRKSAENLDEQLALYREKEEQLVIRSPIEGEVVTWKIHDRLIHRPVQKGQTLMTVVDPTGPWELLIDMPERRMGFVERARRDSDEPLAVAFQLKSNPGDEFEGHVVEVRRVADTRSGGETTVRIRVGIDKDQLPELRPGVTATAKVDCGRRSIGYVWFHDVISFVQTKILFWF